MKKAILYITIFLGILCIFFKIAPLSTKKEVNENDLGFGYKKVQENVFYYNTLIKNIDTNTLEILTKNSGNINDGSPIYFRDKNGIYIVKNNIDLIKVPSVDIKNFVLLNNSLAKDSNNIYFDGIMVGKTKNINIDSFHYVGNEYYSDKNYIYTLEAVYTDGIKRVYTSGPSIRVLEGADLESFRIINQQIAQDKNARYSYGKKIIEK